MHAVRLQGAILTLVAFVVGGSLAACGAGQPKPGTVLDEAMRAKRTAASFPAADEDYFHDMDGALPFTKEQVQGRNMWMVWTGGNDWLWDVLAAQSLGSLDFVKTLSSHPTLPYSRDTRWNYLGLVNEPCYRKGHRARSESIRALARLARPLVRARPVREHREVPGVTVGARGRTVPVGSYYGEPSGVVGLRLFPNPDFDEEARRNWDSERYYRDPSYFERRDLVRPYRVGMSCAFCHVGPNPVRPPPDPENPAWSQLASNVGAQYFWWDRVFDWRGQTNEGSFLFQALHTSLPGHTRHVARLHRQHQQPADDERRVSAGAAHGPGEAVGQGDAVGRRAGQQAVQQLRAAGRSAVAVFHGTLHHVDTARAEGRVRLRGRARRAQPRVPRTSGCSAKSGCCTSAR